MSVKKCNASSAYIGVTLANSKSGVFVRYNGMWKATISMNGKTVNLGYFITEREAAIAYDKKAIEIGRGTNILKLKAA